MIRSYDRAVRLPVSKLSWAVAVGTALTVQAGCARTLHVGGDRSLRIALNEYRLNPGNARAAPGPLTLEIHNYGRLTHNLVISENGQSIASTRGIAPGHDAELTLTLGPGHYQMASSLMSDEALGEYGTLTVGR
jgi:hypothetical protein